MNKHKLRRFYKKKRQALEASTRSELSLKIANQALKLPIWEFSFYHLFLSIKSLEEVDTEPLLTILFGKDKQVVVPKINVVTFEMKHYLLTDATAIKPNIWNIPEPLDGTTIEASKIQLVFVPLLAFDKKGQRVGYGKGFYDRFLKGCPKALKIGISFFGPIKEITDIQSSDIALDYCITPNQIYQFQ